MIHLIATVATSVLLFQRSSTDTVSIALPGGGVIEADQYGTGARAVVLVAHGGYSYKARWKPQAEALVQGGLRVLVIETRGAAEFRAGKETVCLYDARCIGADILAAVRYLRQAGAGAVSVVAGSAGGGGAAQATVDAPGEIERLVLLAPAPIDHPERITGRTLFMTSRDDRNDEGLRLPGIRAQYAKVPGPKKLVIIEGSAHGQLMFDTTDRERITRELVRFLTKPEAPGG